MGALAECESRRLFALRKALVSFLADYGPKGCRGRAESPLHCFIKRQLCRKEFPPARIGTGRPMGRSIVLGSDPKGVQGGERKAPLLAALGNNFAVSNSPLAGPDAPTPARIGTGRPMGRSHFSFGGERKVCKRKPAARRLREKALDCPFCRRGSQRRAHYHWLANTNVRARSCARLFPPSK